jgi:hypothetical protein
MLVVAAEVGGLDRRDLRKVDGAASNGAASLFLDSAAPPESVRAEE